MPVLPLDRPPAEAEGGVVPRVAASSPPLADPVEEAHGRQADPEEDRRYELL